MMLNKGALNGQRVLKPETVAEMTRNQTGALNARPGMPWGLGFCVVEDPTKMPAEQRPVTEFVRPWRSVQHPELGRPGQKPRLDYHVSARRERQSGQFRRTNCLSGRCRQGTRAVK